MVDRRLARLLVCASVALAAAALPGHGGVADAASAGSGHAMAAGTTVPLAPTATTTPPTTTSTARKATTLRKATTRKPATTKRAASKTAPATVPPVLAARASAASPALLTAPPLTAAATTTTATTTTLVPTTMVTPQGTNWTLTWSDEFTNGLNPDWNVITTGGGVFDDTFGDECYQPGQVSVANGALNLTAAARNVSCRGGSRRYVSGLVTTRNKFSQTYGRFEARIRMPVVRGTWPAWWLMPSKPVYGEWPGSGEIDVMEYVGDWPDVVYHTVHWAEGGTHLQDASAWHVTDTTAEWHTYALEWERGELRWFVDDVLTKTYRPPTGAAPFDQSFYLILNQAVGGNWAGTPSNADLPSTVSVDWVRVYQRTS